MLDLIKYIVNSFAEHTDKIEYIVNETENAVDVTVVLEESDMGKVIGKQGKIAKAMRTGPLRFPERRQKIQYRNQGKR